MSCVLLPRDRLQVGILVMEPLEPGDPRHIGKYPLLGRLGSGGMGRVFLGQSPGGRLVAVKLIRAELAADERFRARFAREVGAARNVSGIFTAPVVDADPDGPQPWLVTAYVPGPSLADAVNGHGPLPLPTVLTLAAGLAEGLAAIHAAGVVHRDLKPANVLLAADGPRIIDFGLSRSSDSMTLTHTGRIVGSPGYMSPEQAEGLTVGPATDVFSLGSVLTFAATGTGPFGTGSAMTLMYRIVNEPPDTSGLPQQLRPLVDRCLAKDPASRPTPDEILAGLGACALAEDWLPARLRSALQGYERPASGWPVTARLLASPAAATALVSPPAQPAPGRRRPRPGRRRPWAAAGAAAVAVAAASALVVAHLLAAASVRRAAAPGPRAVVSAYFAAINAHDWRHVWRLGGKNLGRPYPAMVAGYQLTARDVVTSITVHGAVATVRFRAYETTGAVQTYQVSYLVRDGAIQSGQQTLLTTGPAVVPATGAPPG
jgi:Protein kinase domain